MDFSCEQKHRNLQSYNPLTMITMQTGNKKLDEAIARAAAKAPLKAFQLIPVDEPINKYHTSEKADRTDADGTLFASKAEMQRWHELVIAQRQGLIRQLEKQVPFILQKEFDHEHEHVGKVGRIAYVADFVYVNVSLRKGLEWKKIVEDSKTGIRTKEYIIKRKLFLKLYPDYYFFEV